MRTDSHNAKSITKRTVTPSETPCCVSSPVSPPSAPCPDGRRLCHRRASKPRRRRTADPQRTSPETRGQPPNPAENQFGCIRASCQLRGLTWCVQAATVASEPRCSRLWISMRRGWVRAGASGSRQEGTTVEREPEECLGPEGEPLHEGVRKHLRACDTSAYVQTDDYLCRIGGLLKARG